MDGCVNPAGGDGDGEDGDSDDGGMMERAVIKMTVVVDKGLRVGS